MAGLVGLWYTPLFGRRESSFDTGLEFRPSRSSHLPLPRAAAGSRQMGALKCMEKSGGAITAPEKRTLDSTDLPRLAVIGRHNRRQCTSRAQRHASLQQQGPPGHLPRSFGERSPRTSCPQTFSLYSCLPLTPVPIPFRFQS